MKKRLVLIAVLLLGLLLCGLFACDKVNTTTALPILADEDEGDCSHIADEGEYFSGDCLTYGYTVYTCTECGEVLYTKYDTAYGAHEMIERKVEGTCKDYSKIEHYCTVCKKIIYTETSNTLGSHNYRNVNETVKGNCQTPTKTITKRCQICGDEIYTLGALGGCEYAKGVYHAPTCTSYDYTTFTCKLCGKIKTEPGTTIGNHSFVITETPGANCQVYGNRNYYCTVCGLEKEEKTSARGAHNYIKTDEDKHTCTICQQTESHTTLLKSLSEDKHQAYCSVCKSYCGSASDHAFTPTTVASANCLTKARIKNACSCGYSFITEEGEALGHNFSEINVVTKETCTHNGLGIKTCLRCKATEEVTIDNIDRTEHDFEEKADSKYLAVSQSCTSSAKYYKVCKFCQEVSTETFVEGSPSEHVYMYYNKGNAHEYRCAVCSESAYTEDHIYISEDDKNGYSHTKRCTKCGYKETSEHDGIKQTNTKCITCLGTAMTGYDKKWDVSTNGDQSVLLYLKGTTLYLYGKRGMKNYSYSVQPPYYEDCKNATELNIDCPSVGNYAFASFTSLETVTLNSSSIGEYAFADTYLLTDLNLTATECNNFSENNGVFRNAGKSGSGITVMTYSAPDYFLYPSKDALPKIKTVNYIGGTNVGKYAFYAVPEITADLSETTTVREYAFYAIRSGLITLGDRLSSVEEYAFYNAESSFIGHGNISSLGEFAFYSCSKLEYISIGDQLTFIPDNCFTSTSLTDISFGNGVTSIGKYAFENTAKLVNVTLQDSVETIGEKAFYQSGIYSITLSNVLTIGKECFSMCKNLSEADAPRVYSIGEKTFYSCTSLRSVALGIEVVPTSAFENCVSLVSADIPKLIKVESRAFKNCEHLVSFYLPTTATSIGYEGFEGCATLAEIKNLSAIPVTMGAISNGKIAQHTKRIYTSGESAISYQDGLIWLLVDDKYYVVGADGTTTAITVPATKDGKAVAIVDYAFYNNVSLTSITINTSEVGQFFNTGCTGTVAIGDQIASDGGRYYILRNTGLNAYQLTVQTSYEGETTTTFSSILEKKEMIRSVRLVSIYSIEESAFADFTALETVDLGSDIVNIGNYAFQNCHNLISVTLPNSITSIGQGAFYNCYRLAEINYNCQIDSNTNRDIFYSCGLLTQNGTKLTFGPDTTSIPNFMFSSTTSSTAPNITSVEYKGTITSIGEKAFYGINTLTEFVIPDSVESVGSQALSRTTIEKITMPKASFLHDVFGTTLPSTVKIVTVTQDATVDEDAFKDCSYLEQILYSNNVTSIKKSAFENCAKLTSFVFDEVQEIGDQAFFGSGITSVVIQDITLGKKAFYQCNRLQSITLTNVKELDSSSFIGCKNVTRLTITESDYTSLSIGSAFGIIYDNSLLTFVGTEDEIDLSEADSVYTIGEGAFSSSDIKEAILPDNLTVIGKNAFASCLSLTTVQVGEELTTINEKAFASCEKLTSIHLNNSKVNSIGASAFFECVSLKEISLPSNINSIGESAFEGCRVLKSFSINGETTIPRLNNNLFLRCVSLSKITIPESVTTIGSSAFERCSSLAEVTFGGEKLTTISSKAFYNCRNLTSLILPDSVSSLGENALIGCIGLKTLKIGKSVSNLQEGFLNGCSSLTTLTLPFIGTNKSTTEEDNNQYPFGAIFGTSSYDKSISQKQTYISTITTSDNTKTTGTETRTYFVPSSLTTVTITGGRLLQGAFSGCTTLKTIILTDSGIQVIGISAFEGCSSLTSLSLPDTVTTLSARAFLGCVNYDGIELPNNCNIIDTTAFTNTKFYSNSSNWGETENDKNILYIKKANGNVYVVLAKKTTNIKKCIVRDDTVGILDKAFVNADFDSLVLPKTLRSIGTSVLEGNNYIKSLSTPFCASDKEQNSSFLGYFFGAEDKDGNATSVPDNLTELILTGEGSVSAYICSGCSNLKKVTLSDTYYTIGEKAFYNCSSLEEVTFPKNLTTIEKDAFFNTLSIKSLTLPVSLTAIGIGAFAYDIEKNRDKVCLRYLSTPFIGNNAETNLSTSILGFIFSSEQITASENGKYVPPSLTTVVVTGKQSAIPSNAFYGCNKLMYVIFGSSVTSVGNTSFSGCSSLDTIYIVGGKNSPSGLRADDRVVHLYFDKSNVNASPMDGYINNPLLSMTSDSSDIGTIETTFVSSDESILQFYYTTEDNKTVSTASEGIAYFADGVVDNSKATVTCHVKVNGAILFDITYTVTVKIGN